MSSNGDFGCRIVGSSHLWDDFHWWHWNILGTENPLEYQACSLFFFDSSFSSWGAYCNEEKAHGFWNEEEKKCRIKLFASRKNTKCSKYVAWKRVPELVAVDVFHINWRPFFFYVFPVLYHITSTRKKFILDELPNSSETEDIRKIQ